MQKSLIQDDEGSYKNFARKILINNPQREVIMRDVLAHNIYQQWVNEGQNKTLVIIGILTGAYKMVSDLGPVLGLPHQVDFIKLKSYKGQERGEISILLENEIDIKDKFVVLMDEYCDSGHTLKFAKEYLEKQEPFKVITATFLYKENDLIKPDHFGQKIDKNDKSWFYGYGLDLDGFNRSDKCIYILSKE